VRVHNFNPGPAALPLSVLERVRDELVDYRQSGMSIIEHSHRGPEYEEIHHAAFAAIRELLGVPDSHELVFMQGGAHLQFGLVPLSFLPPGGSADYLITGGWAERAAEEARTVGRVREAARSIGVRIPERLELDAGAAYVHLTSNNTLEGTQWPSFPDTGAVPLVADMSSDIFSRPIDVARFSLIYACAQKNLGPSGVTLLIASKDFLSRARADLPPSFRYDSYVKTQSLYNTPPTFSIHVARYVLDWLREQGGLAAVDARNREKAALVYGVIDEQPDFFRSPVERGSRSLMNVVFRLPDEELDKRFVAEAKRAGLVGVKGHRIVGGLRVSLYNAVTLESTRVLCEFMRDFARGVGGGRCAPTGEVPAPSFYS
jgi:phosphoserine aminotransferase